MTYIDQFYSDTNGSVHFLSAQDQAAAAAKTWSGPQLPDPAWTAITEAEAKAKALPTPSDEQLKAAAKAQARTLLAATDYTQTADIAGLISNVAAFTAYRASVREIFRNPTTEPTWPALPDPVWI